MVATTAKNTLRVPITAAARGLTPFWLPRRWMFSSTTIASSTTNPVASTNASSVIRLSENPSSQIAATVPISATGIATAGISAARNCPMNSAITVTTIDHCQRQRHQNLGGSRCG